MTQYLNTFKRVQEEHSRVVDFANLMHTTYAKLPGSAVFDWDYATTARDLVTCARFDMFLNQILNEYIQQNKEALLTEIVLRSQNQFNDIKDKARTEFKDLFD